MTRRRWALSPHDSDGRWHALAHDEPLPGITETACGNSLPTNRLDPHDRPGDRACIECALTAGAELHDPGAAAPPP